MELPTPHVSPTSSSSKPSLSIGCKRPALPAKEYEEAADQLSLTFAYDYTTMTAWLSHPVKKSRPSDGPREKPLQPMFRRRSQHNIFAPVYMEVAKAEVKPTSQRAYISQAGVKAFDERSQQQRRTPAAEEGGGGGGGWEAGQHRARHLLNSRTEAQPRRSRQYV